MKKITLNAENLTGYLSDDDTKKLSHLEGLYDQAMKSFAVLDKNPIEKTANREKQNIIDLFTEMGKYMKQLTEETGRIHVYPFETPEINQGEASRLIAKLRDIGTEHEEFVYYIQRAYELLFNLAYGAHAGNHKNHLIVKTPVTYPVQNFAVHKIPDIDDLISNSVMCVMLRGALLPSMIMSKEIEEYSSTGYITPFALFKIKRDDDKTEKNMDYILDLNKSYFDLESLQGKDLIFADPMNATGGSFVTIVKYLKEQNIKPRSIKLFTVISALKGCMNVIRALDDVEIYTLWMDPVLNTSAYIMPGLGDAGDRLNGADHPDYPRNVLQLIADYGSNIVHLYRSQVREIENTILD